MYKLVKASSDEIDKHKELFGGFNDFPPKWSEMSEKEFARSGFGKSRVEYIEYRQMMYPKHLVGKGGNIPAYLFFIGDGIGYAVVQDYWDSSVRFFKFDCIDILEDFFSNLPILNDTQWNMNKTSSIPQRGIRDYSRTIEFDRDLTSEELNLLKQFLARDGCPGWTGVRSIRLKTGVYKFNTTWDSSD
jgi:hypothetical protein